MLSAATKTRLRRNAHHLKPVVQTGQQGVTAAVITEIDRALTDHELIKVRFRGIARDQRKDEIQRVAADLEAAVVTIIGGTAVLYRESEKIRSKRSST